MKSVFTTLILLSSIIFAQNKALPGKYFEAGISFTEAALENPSAQDSIFRGHTLTGAFAFPILKTDSSSFNLILSIDYMELKNIVSSGFQEELKSLNPAAGFSHKIYDWSFGYGASYVLYKTKLTHSSVYTNTEEYSFYGYKLYAEYIKQFSYIYMNARYTFQSASIPQEETSLSKASSFSSHSLGLFFTIIFP